MAQGEVRCPCGKVCGSPNALWTHVQGKALHGDAEHQEMYSEDGFDESPQEDEPEESEDKDQEGSKDENILDDYRENVENDTGETGGEQVKELESSVDEGPEYDSIENVKSEAPPKVRKLLEKMQEKGAEEIEVNTDKNWVNRDIR